MTELKVKWEAIPLTLCQMCTSPAGWRTKAHMTPFPKDRLLWVQRVHSLLCSLLKLRGGQVPVKNARD